MYTIQEVTEFISSVVVGLRWGTIWTLKVLSETLNRWDVSLGLTTSSGWIEPPIQSIKCLLVLLVASLPLHAIGSLILFKEILEQRSSRTPSANILKQWIYHKFLRFWFVGGTHGDIGFDRSRLDGSNGFRSVNGVVTDANLGGWGWGLLTLTINWRLEDLMLWSTLLIELFI